MSTSKDIELSYRSLQAVHDLRAVARRASGSTFDRIGGGLPGNASPQVFQELIGPAGCRMTTDVADAVHHALLLSATLPDDDFDAFQAATAILLADRLQRGAGDDDLFWHWDAFQEHYRMMPPGARAAVFHGYFRANAEKLVSLYDPPRGLNLQSEERKTIEDRLNVFAADAVGDLRPQHPEFPRNVAGLLAAAMSDDIARTSTANVWARHGAQILEMPAAARETVTRGFRYFYEADTNWNPHRGLTFSIAGNPPPLLPPAGS